jgi:TonB-dependent receptor
MAFVNKKKMPAIFPVAGLLIWALLAGFPVRSKAQDVKTTRVTISVHGKTLKEVFRELEQKTGLSINFQDSVVDASRKVDIDAGNEPLAAVLTRLLAGTHADFIQQGNMIILVPRKEPDQKKEPAVATLKGRIVDFETDQPMPGATVGILETGRSVLSDNKGYYEFTRLPEGTYTLVVSYTGYDKNVLPGIRVTSGHPTAFDVKMAAGKSLDQVVVQGGAHRIKTVTHSTDKELIAEIRSATGSVSGISNEQISKSADRNAAEVVKKIAGVSVVDERFIIVRGMNERYNLTYLNGNVAPSTELYDKAFAYDLLPSPVIDKILVYKSPVADMVADYGGAAIKVFTKNAMPVKHLDIGAQVAHRPGSTMTNINSYSGGKYDFLGFDDGTRKLPWFAPSYFQSNKQVSGIDQQTMVKAFSPVLDYGTAHSLPDMQFFVNYYDNFKIGRHIRLYDLTSVTYTHETRFFGVYEQTGNTYAYPFVDQAGSSLIGQNNQITNSQQTTEIGKVNVLENLTLKWNKHNSISLKNFFINEGRVLTTVNSSHDNELPVIDSTYHTNYPQHTINLSFQQRLLYFGNLTGEHTFGTGDRQELAWNLGYTFSQQNVPDQRNSSFYSGQYPYAIAGEPSALGYVAAGTNTGSVGDGDLGMISRTFIKLNDNVNNGSLDYTFHARPDLSLKAGTYQLFKTREVGRRIFLVNRGGLQPGEFLQPPGSESIGQGWAEGYGNSNPNLIFFRQQYLNTIWNPANFPNDGSGLAIYDATTVSDSYVGSEQNNAGYLMGDWNPVGKALTLNAGLRVEYDCEKIAGGTDNGAGANIDPIKASHSKTSFLPSVNITYRPGSLFVIRSGYGRTVNRPELRELTPYNDFDYQTSETIIGNPSLVSATIDNYDLRAEFYPRSSRQNELFNAGIFYKTLRNPIERMRSATDASSGPGNFTIIGFDNAISAKIYGVEAEVRKNLSFIPGKLFHDLSIFANAAFIKSTTVDPTQDQNGNIRDTGVNVPGRPLQGQSPYVINAGLFYENPSWGTRIGASFNVSGPRIYAKSVANSHSKEQVSNSGDSSVFDGIRPDLLELPRKLLDLSLSQRIVSSLVLKVSMQNLLKAPFRIVEDHNYNQRYDKEYPVPVTSSSNGRLTPGVTYYYYQGDNIYNKYNPGQYFLCQLTYAF